MSEEITTEVEGMNLVISSVKKDVQQLKKKENKELELKTAELAQL